MGKFKVTKARSGMSFILTGANGAEIARANASYGTLGHLLNGIERIRDIAVSAPIEDKTVSHYLPITNPKYEIWRNNCGEKFYFQLRAQNGKIVLMSDAYMQKASCLKGIESVRKNAATSKVVLDSPCIMKK